MHRDKSMFTEIRVKIRKMCASPPSAEEPKLAKKEKLRII
jgi:hypothetical protein